MASSNPANPRYLPTTGPLVSLRDALDGSPMRAARRFERGAGHLEDRVIVVREFVIPQAPTLDDAWYWLFVVHPGRGTLLYESLDSFAALLAHLSAQVPAGTALAPRWERMAWPATVQLVNRPAITLWGGPPPAERRAGLH